MNRIKDTFQMLAKKNEAALITYLTAGYPTLDSSMEYIERFAKYADIIEVGIPFSDPIADGKMIQYASYIALRNDINLFSILDALSMLRIEKPIVIMSYLNPLLSFGLDYFFKKINKIGISGLIVPDLVVEESGIVKRRANRYSVDLIQLVAPTSDDERIKLINKVTEGFVYCVSLTGTTGIRKRLPEHLPLFIKRVKFLVYKPVVVGFGISRFRQVKELSKIADGVVIGSRIIEAIKNREDVDFLVKKFKRATVR